MRKAGSLLLVLCWLGQAQVHKVPVDNSWFPAERAQLEKVLEQAFAISEKRTGTAPPRKQLLALVAPHAALQYSGAVAASAYRLLGSPKNIVLLGFSHRRRLAGITAPVLEAYSTPLGRIAVNREALRELGFPQVPESQLCDHSLENQLPLVVRAAPQSRLIPLYVGDMAADELAAAARKLANRIRQGDIVVASSDLTHYGESYGYAPFPKDAQLAQRLRGRAIEIFERIGALSVPAFDRFLAVSRENLCGRAPIRLLMAALGELQQEVYLSPLDYLASGELTGDYSLSVGYGALAFYPASAFGLDQADQGKLLASARKTLDQYLATGLKLRVPVPREQRDPDLEQRSGVFVTIRQNGQLRGCVGALFTPRPLWEAVADRTLAAASEDPRFPPLKKEDGPVSLEVSVLTPLRKLQSAWDFRIGQGAVLLLGAKSGTILPQIAQEMHWSREQFLENLSRKAGLLPDAYKDPRAEVYVYTAQVLAEAPPHAATGGSR